MDSVTRKRETPKKLHNDWNKPYENTKRKTVKLSALSVGYIDCYKKKNQSYGQWVAEAINLKYFDMEQRKEHERIAGMTQSSTYHENVKLRDDVDGLMREIDKIKGFNDIFIQKEAKHNIWQKHWDKKMDALNKRQGLGPYKRKR